jgi:hypothetical protein
MDKNIDVARYNLLITRDREIAQTIPSEFGMVEFRVYPEDWYEISRQYGEDRLIFDIEGAAWSFLSPFVDSFNMIVKNGDDSQRGFFTFVFMRAGIRNTSVDDVPVEQIFQERIKIHRPLWEKIFR